MDIKLIDTNFRYNGIEILFIFFVSDADSKLDADADVDENKDTNNVKRWAEYV